MAAKDILAAVGMAALCAAFFALGRVTAPEGPICPVEEKVDTLYVRDTITAYKPIFVEREVVRRDTLRICDTVEVEVPIERRVYQDSNYRAVVSGWHPSLDEISVYPLTKVVTRTEVVRVKEKARWGLGLTAGYGAGKGGLTPYVGAGVTYNLLSW